MNPLEMQPTFVVQVEDSVDDALRKLRQAIKSPELAGRAESAGPCLDFKVAADELRFWSPHLSVQLFEADGGCELFCRFSPRPEIWTGVMAIYFGAVTAMFFAAVYAYVQWYLGHAPWALLVLPVAAAVIGGLHVASLMGQRWSSDQMHALRSRFDRAVELAFGAAERANVPEMAPAE